MDFIVKNYVIIVIIAAFLIFALIGYVVDSAKNKKNKEADLLTQPNDEVDINMIKEEQTPEQSFTENVTSAPITEDENQINMNMGN